MRVLRAGVMALVVVAVALPADAEAADSFTACVMVERGGDCVQRTSVLYGSTVYLRGKVVPVQEGRAKVLKRAPGEDDWVKIATVDVNEDGVMRYAWETTLEDAYLDQPNLLRFKIAGVGRSEKVKVHVFAGE